MTKASLQSSSKAFGCVTAWIYWPIWEKEETAVTSDNLPVFTREGFS